MREGATKFMKAAAERDQQRKALENVTVLGKMLKTISPFLKVPKATISKEVYDLTSNGIADPQELLSRVGILDDVHFVRYTSRTCDLRKVLSDLTNTPLWSKFCSVAGAEKTRQTVLFVALHGGTYLVITNKSMFPAPGYVFHGVASNNENFNTVYMFNWEYLPMFLKPEQIHTN